MDVNMNGAGAGVDEDGCSMLLFETVLSLSRSGVPLRVPVHMPIELSSYGAAKRFRPPHHSQFPISLRPHLFDYVSPPNDSSLEPLLKALSAYKHLKRLFQQMQVLTFRNNLNKMAAADSPFAVCVEVFRGVLVLDIVDSGKTDGEDETDESKMGRIWESMCVAASSAATTVPENAIAVSSEQHCQVIGVRLANDYLIAMGAEMDAMDSQGRPIEIKCWKSDSSHGQGQGYGQGQGQGPGLRNVPFRKLRKAWVQCFLANVPTLIVGMRNAEGQVVQVVDEDVESLPDKYRFDAYYSLRNIVAFLNIISRNCKKEGVVYKVEFCNVSRSDGDSDGSVRIYQESEPQHRVVPAWFRQHVDSLFEPSSSSSSA
eukprot:ANDGO_01806.mRNA.1 hypothetical protein